MTPLPKEEIERIEKEADVIFNPKDIPGCPQEIAFQLGQQCAAYIAGAVHEAERGREMMTGFCEWKDNNYINYQMQDGRYYHKRDLLKHVSEATVFTTAELADLYILDNLKKKG